MDLPFLIIIVSILINRVLSNLALKNLSAKEKGKLVESFSRLRLINLIPFFLIILFFLFSIYFPPSNLTTAIYLSFILLLPIYLISVNIYVYNKLKKLKFPKNYILVSTAGSAVSVLGIIIGFTMIFLEFKAIGN